MIRVFQNMICAQFASLHQYLICSHAVTQGSRMISPGYGGEIIAYALHSTGYAPTLKVQKIMWH